ncbi:TauD/TfdA family dioxygenase [Amycolatopsis minnesotensis]|uniref:TauD/TfdA family dioxygenase n=1 Tax=Amycolatopsis minnesotensis TaxID=337894 RepID=A0ABN2PXH9_9PSEU
MTIPIAMGHVRQCVASAGYAVVRQCGFTDGVTVDEARVRRLLAPLGRLSERDGGVAVWPVRPVTGRPGATFSVRSGAALLHTDAAYRAHPEDLVALLCVRPASDGGVSELLHHQDARVALSPEIAAELGQPQWTWQPPDEFGGSATESLAVLAPDRVRWRRDNLVAAAALLPVADAWQAHLQAASGLRRVTLGTDDLLVFSNHRVLHGRTAFTDPGRFLLRVRLWGGPELPGEDA